MQPFVLTRFLKSGNTALRAATLLMLALPALAVQAATSILFLGNSFTYGAFASVQTYQANTVTDLNISNGLSNGTGAAIGGVPALFKAFTVQAGLDYNVSLETYPGIGLDWHYNNRLAQINKPWDKVVMHGQSTLDFSAPGNPTNITTNSKLLAQAFVAQNPNVDISLTATWARADQTYLPSGFWYGKPISAMANDVQAGYDFALTANSPLIQRVNPVGLAWNRAMDQGLADPNPYDGITPGQLNLWASENYHASNYGYYLHALVVFGNVTGLDPRTLGGAERAAMDLGFTAGQTVALQTVAWQQLNAAPVPEPATVFCMGLGALWMLVLAKGRRRR
jgi:hypothetical protein